ncbi:hypothetical protein [Aerosakkonema funiforme]
MTNFGTVEVDRWDVHAKVAIAFVDCLEYSCLLWCKYKLMPTIQ